MRGLGDGARHAEGAAVRAVAALLAVTAAACSSSPGAAPGAPGARRGASPPAVAIPLDTTLPTPSGTVAVVAMGLLHDPLNTFWQLFSRAGGEDGWTLVTPPGVADNGGLVAGSSGSDRAPPGGSLLVGFEPSQDLVFSPLAQSADQGRTWSAGLVPSGLMAVPDALALAPDGEALALLRPHGGEVVRSTGATSAWTTLVRAAGLASAPGASACGVGRLTAIGFDTAGAPLVATSCSVPGVSGIFESTGGRWRLVGPRLAVDAAGDRRPVGRRRRHRRRPGRHGPSRAPRSRRGVGHHRRDVGSLGSVAPGPGRPHRRHRSRARGRLRGAGVVRRRVAHLGHRGGARRWVAGPGRPPRPGPPPWRWAPMARWTPWSWRPP